MAVNGIGIASFIRGTRLVGSGNRPWLLVIVGQYHQRVPKERKEKLDTFSLSREMPLRLAEPTVNTFVRARLDLIYFEIY